MPPEKARVAVFYSISNCQKGLAGISFGNFLIKQVVQELRRDFPRLETFVTLSPAPGFLRWVAERDFDVDTQFTVAHEMRRRREEQGSEQPAGGASEAAEPELPF